MSIYLPISEWYSHDVRDEKKRRKVKEEEGS